MLKMKYSGVKWLGNIPDEWKVVRVDYYKDLKSNYPIGDGDHGTVTPEDYINEGIPYIRVQNLSWGNHIITDNIVYISETINKKNKKSILKPGDIVIAKTGATIGKIGIIPEEMPEANTTSSVGKVSVDNKYSNKYVFYSLLSDSSYQQMWDKANMKSAQPGFNIEDLVKFKICFPSIKEQYLIANFLDKKVGTINSIICDLNDQIEILYKYKKQIITESVTTGLNKNVNFKDSGIDWMGKMPKHWIVKPLKYMFYMYAGGDVNEYDFSDIKEENYIYPIYSNSLENKGLFGFTSKYRFSGKTFTVTGRGDIGYAIPRFDKYYPIVRLLVCVPKNGDDNRYYSYCVNSANVIGDQTAMAQLTTQRLGMVKVPHPPLEEQKIIADYLDKKCSEIEEILNSKIKQKEQMEQYKKSVIYEYVTGKKRVEGAEELYG